MADTRQSVKWALEWGCPIRQQEDWSTATLSRAQTYSRYATHTRRGERFGIHDGICVTAVSTDTLPLNGFTIAEEFAPAGGAEGLRELCGNCPANTALEGLAGCTGWFSFAPYSEELDQQLRQVAEELGLTEAILRGFPSTALLWFAFWINSPLSLPAMDILTPLLEAFVERHLSDDRADRHRESSLLSFLRAMEWARYYDLKLRVEMAPPGHTDFGWYTIFAHCPRCKAGAPVEPWKKVRHAWITCGMCGHEFDPAVTASRSAMTYDGDDNDLREKLGEERYRTFAIGYLVAHGRATAYATTVVDKYLAPPDPALLERRRQQDMKSQEKRHFIATVLCAGFERVQPDAGPREDRVSNDYLLTFEEAELLLQRSRQWGATVSGIHHHAQDDDLDEIWVSCRDFETPEAALQDLRDQGCSELFSVVVGISDEAFETWKGQQG